MHANVHITVRKDGKVIDTREGHNVWVDDGRSYLANMISYTSPVLSTTEGTLDLVSDFPALSNEFLIFRQGHHTGWVETRLVLSSPANAGDLLTQLNGQLTDVVVSLGGSNGLVFTGTTPNPLEIVAGTAMRKLGLSAHLVPASGMTTTPNADRRIKYMGFGIGGDKQSLVTPFFPPLVTDYPPGFDPNATAGNAYRKEVPHDPLIRSLERPIRIVGGSTPYPGVPGDRWLIQPPKFVNYIQTLGVMSFHGTIDTSVGDVVYGPYSEMPLSEVGLFTDDADPFDAYNVGALVAYYSFGTILLSAGIILELVWTVSL